MIANEKNMVNYKVLDLAELSNFHINFVFIRFYLKKKMSLFFLLPLFRQAVNNHLIQVAQGEEEVRLSPITVT